MLDPMLFTTTNRCKRCGAAPNHNCETRTGRRLHIFAQHAGRKIRRNNYRTVHTLVGDRKVTHA